MTATLKAEVKGKALDFRNLQRLLDTPEFEQAWAKDPDSTFVRFAITSGNVEEIKRWIKATLTEEVGEMNLRSLRARAAQLGIPRVTLYNKDELIVKIVQVQDARKTQSAAG